MNSSRRIVIIGAGPAGIATALRLRQLGFADLTVVEAGDQTAPKIGETLTPPCQQELQALGVWPDFLADAHLPASLTGAAWGSAHVEFNDFIFRPVGRGWHLDRARFDRRLTAFAEERGIVVHRRTRLTRSIRQAAGWQLELVESGGAPRLADCDFVVDASGRKAVFARAQGAESLHFHELFACHRCFAVPISAPTPAGHTLVESVPDGWWYSARLPDDRFVAAFMTDGGTVRSRHTHKPAGWQGALADGTHTAARLRHLAPAGPVQVTPAHSHLLDSVHGGRWLAVGDAAAAYDPLSSMGIHQALCGGIAAAEAIAAQFGGDADALPRYARSLRRFHDRYLEVKAAYYGIERRWPEQPFWAARRPKIYLSPHSRLRAVDVSPSASVNRHLGARAQAELARKCLRSRPAHEVVAEFQREHPDRYSDLQVILALQHAIERHQLAVEASASPA